MGRVQQPQLTSDRPAVRKCTLVRREKRKCSSHHAPIRWLCPKCDNVRSVDALAMSFELLPIAVQTEFDTRTRESPLKLFLSGPHSRKVLCDEKYRYNGNSLHSFFDAAISHSTKRKLFLLFQATDSILRLKRIALFFTHNDYDVCTHAGTRLKYAAKRNAPSRRNQPIYAHTDAVSLSISSHYLHNMIRVHLQH
eukprot:TRINITY_DN1529_c0_g1_i1.p1 TRINITY_DN1529_c0_g1~~TRINITY_DN1529_c0_g1_i1.p1  ORF type:complete len:195 (+),score=8.82 TRINITY_DN1529_c0_g1_i1:523-1107(+)